MLGKYPNEASPLRVQVRSVHLVISVLGSAQYSKILSYFSSSKCASVLGTVSGVG